MDQHHNTIKTLKLLVSTDDKTIRTFIKIAPKHFITSISEICYNILYDTFPLTEDDKKALRRYKSALNRLPRSTNSIKRQILKRNTNLLRVIAALWPNDTY